MTSIRYTSQPHRVRVKVEIVSVLDDKRSREMRASFLRRAAEEKIYGAPVSAPKKIPKRRTQAPQTVIGGSLMLHLACKQKLEDDIWRYCIANGLTPTEFISDLILTTTLEGAF